MQRFLNYEKLCYLFRLVEFCRNFKIRDEHIYLSFNTSLFLFVIFEKLKKKKKRKIRYRVEIYRVTTGTREWNIFDL